jgi:hypothetical protein
MQYEIPVRNKTTRRGMAAFLTDLQKAGLPVTLDECSPPTDIEWEDDTSVCIRFGSSEAAPADSEVDEFDRDEDYGDDTEGGLPDGVREVRLAPWVEEAYARTIRFLADNDQAAKRWLSRRGKSGRRPRPRSVAEVERTHIPTSRTFHTI